MAERFNIDEVAKAAELCNSFSRIAIGVAHYVYRDTEVLPIVGCEEAEICKNSEGKQVVRIHYWNGSGDEFANCYVDYPPEWLNLDEESLHGVRDAVKAISLSTCPGPSLELVRIFTDAKRFVQSFSDVGYSHNRDGDPVKYEYVEKEDAEMLVDVLAVAAGAADKGILKKYDKHYVMEILPDYMKNEEGGDDEYK